MSLVSCECSKIHVTSLLNSIPTASPICSATENETTQSAEDKPILNKNQSQKAKRLKADVTNHG